MRLGYDWRLTDRLHHVSSLETSRARHDEGERTKNTKNTLEKVRSSYFPVSKMWGLRERAQWNGDAAAAADKAAPPAHARTHPHGIDL